MPIDSDSLPLADVLRAANDLVTAGLIEDWSLGGALAASRAKDKARIEQLLQQADLDQSRLKSILHRHKLKLPKP